MGKMIWNRLEPELKKQRIVYQVYMTEAAGHACKISRHITEDGKEHTLVVLGGDGTVNEVLNGMLDVSKVTLGYIPIGPAMISQEGCSSQKTRKRRWR